MKRTMMTDGIYRKYEKLAYWTAHSWNRTTGADDIEELIDISILTLVEAHKLFDSEKGYRFSTYAKCSINNKLYNFISKENKKKNVIKNVEKLPEIAIKSDIEEKMALKQMIESLSKEAQDVVNTIFRGTLEIFDIIPGDRLNTIRRKIKEKAGLEVFNEIKMALKIYLW